MASLFSDDSDCPPDVLDALRLAMIPGVGPRLRESLLAALGSPAAILTAAREVLLQVEGIGPKLANSIIENRHPADARREWVECQARNIDLRLRGTPAYPPSLEKIPDPPSVLYVQGTLEPRDQVAVAIVGSRRCTAYGRRQAERLARGLANAGMTIISGLARGIDGCAHRGALAVGGRTIAVTATGLTKIYPPEHADLARDISRQGALVTESPLGQEPIKGLFPQRNRIISGLSLGVVLVEASRNSGALHTARHAMEQGRDVFAVPGPIDNLESEGCHDLIRDGAALVRGVDDILESLGPLMKPVAMSPGEEVRSPRELTLNEPERLVLNAVTNDPQHLDNITRSCGIEVSRVSSTLLILEMKRLVRRLPGSLFVRIPQ
ncbi:MAG: DNA-protecting protein DprA [Planctomycetaceae bacterium]|nr:DNA-protecting protein DprA [Planctomycetaceae bacterium]